MKKISFYAFWLEKICIFFMAFLPIQLIIRWTQDKIPFLKQANVWIPSLDYPAGSISVDSLYYLQKMTFLERFIGFFIDLGTVIIVMGGLYVCAQLMQNFRAGEIFSFQTISRLRTLTTLALVWTGYSLLNVLMMTSIILNETPEQVALSMGYATDSAFIKAVFFGFLLIITIIMQEGFRLKSEQDLTI